jgi:peptidoglycan/xylan/chitin deacetylase (PgdA/CDA1 family)
VRPSVCLTFDFDGFAIWLGGSPSATDLSRAEFGARLGVPRLLDLLAREEIPATFFTPGHTADSFPKLCREVAAHGHEIAHHGYLHLDTMSLDEATARAEIERGLQALERVAGRVPVGYRTPGFGISGGTLELLVEYGFEYDSSLMGQDFEPYYVRSGDRVSADTPFAPGAETALIELPMLISMVDAPQMEFRAQPLLPGLHANEKVYETWREEFDWMRDRVPGGVLVVVLHPSTIARGARLRVLERLVTHMKAHSAEFTCMRDTAASWRARLARNGLADADVTTPGREP